jgi:hypothetical protein
MHAKAYLVCARAVLRNAHPRLRLKQQQLRSKDGNGKWSRRHSDVRLPETPVPRPWRSSTTRTPDAYISIFQLPPRTNSNDSDPGLDTELFQGGLCRDIGQHRQCWRLLVHRWFCIFVRASLLSALTPREDVFELNTALIP